MGGVNESQRGGGGGEDATISFKIELTSVPNLIRSKFDFILIGHIFWDLKSFSILYRLYFIIFVYFCTVMGLLSTTQRYTVCITK